VTQIGDALEALGMIGACLGDPWACITRVAWWLPWLLAGCCLLFIWGLLDRFRAVLAVIHRVSNWQGVAAVVTAIAGIVVAILSAGRKPAGEREQEAPKVVKRVREPASRNPFSWILSKGSSKPRPQKGGGNDRPPGSLTS
jgi:hypothetical protein